MRPYVQWLSLLNGGDGDDVDDHDYGDGYDDGGGGGGDHSGNGMMMVMLMMVAVVMMTMTTVMVVVMIVMVAMMMMVVMRTASAEAKYFSSFTEFNPCYDTSVLRMRTPRLERYWDISKPHSS